MDVGGGRFGDVRDVEVEVGRAVVEHDARKALAVGIAHFVDLAISIERASQCESSGAASQYLTANRSCRMICVVDVDIERRRTVKERSDRAGGSGYAPESDPCAAAGRRERCLEVDRDAAVLAGRPRVNVACSRI